MTIFCPSSPVEVRVVRGKSQYIVKDEQLPRVTAILDCIYKPDLEHWKRKHELEAMYDASVKTFDACVASGTCSSIRYRTMFQYELQEAAKAEKAELAAAEAGTRVHAAIAAILGGGEPNPLEEAEQVQVTKAIEWVAENELEVEAIEEPVYMRGEFGAFAGTPDLVVKWPDVSRSIPDWKTGRGGIWRSYYVQNVVYRRARNWMDRGRDDLKPITRGQIVKLPHDADKPVEVVEVPNSDKHFLRFLACLRIYMGNMED